MPKAVILCVDDEPAVLDSLRRELSEGFHDQYDIETATGGMEALELIEDLLAEDCNLALVIADYLMPDLKGDEVLQRIHLLSPTTLNVMLTGQAGIDGITNAINHANLYRYIAKPWQLADLLLTVKEALNSFFQAQQLTEYQSELERKVEARTRELTQTITTLKQTQSELIRAEKMAALGNLVAGVAHEINTPVGNALLAASVLEQETHSFNAAYRQGNLKRALLQGYLETAEDSSELILGNLNQAAGLIQSFKQVAVDQSSHQKRTFKIVAYLHSILTSLEPQLKQAEHQVSIVGDEDITVTSFPGALSQVITNFVMNSIHHAYASGEKGHLQISVKRLANNRLQIDYSDDGCGIPMESHEKIFEPFFTTTREQGGSGLGLHISHNVITQTLQGSINLLSAENQGSTFTLNIPLIIQDNKILENA